MAVRVWSATRMTSSLSGSLTYRVAWMRTIASARASAQAVLKAISAPPHFLHGHAFEPAAAAHGAIADTGAIEADDRHAQTGQGPVRRDMPSVGPNAVQQAGVGNDRPPRRLVRRGDG